MSNLINESPYEACVYKMMRENRLKNAGHYLYDLCKKIGTILGALILIAIGVGIIYYAIETFGPTIIAFAVWLYNFVVTNLLILCAIIILASTPIAVTSVYFGYKEYSIHEARYACRKAWKEAGKEIDEDADRRLSDREDKYKSIKGLLFGFWVLINLVACFVLAFLVKAALLVVIGLIGVVMVIGVGSMGMFCGFSARMSY